MGCRVMKPQTHGAKITPSVPWRPRLVESRHVNHTIIGERVRITFSDGEVIVGYTLHFDVNGPGFFVFPADPTSNNHRIFVVSGVVKDVRRVA